MRLRSLGVLLLTTGLLAGCGQKGPLYLPKPAQPAAAQPAAPAPASTALPQPVTVPPR